MADCDELEALRKVKGYIKNLESKVRELEEATNGKDDYIKNLESKVRELEQIATKRQLDIERLEQRDEARGRLVEGLMRTIKIREQTVEDLRGYNKVWRNNWCERVMKKECPLFMEFYSGRMSSETFKKHFQTI